MKSGIVYLVGAGPGDPGLLTLRGAELLSSADLVLYDGLVNTLLLRHTQARCERTARTRIGTDRIVPQSEINERLIEEARRGQTVVRLKGGDPFIFGRGSEEAEALQAAGIPFEVVPGITAATAAGEYAGFSFTHRDIASAVAFVTGHEDPTREVSRLDYNALARFPGTLVFYMGLGRLQAICNGLIEHGLSPDTPAAVVCRASLPLQQVVTSTVQELPAAAEQAQLTPPSLIVVGHCVRMRELVSWFEQRPLFGLRIGITRPDHQCDAICRKVTSLSGQPVVMPLIEINQIDSAARQTVSQVINKLEEFDWLIFTSVNGVDAFLRYLWEEGDDVRALGHLKLAAIGSSTAQALERSGLRADVVPEHFRAEALAAALTPHVKNKRVLWARANRGRDVLPKTLTSAGAAVTECVVYRNDDVTNWPPTVMQQLQDGSLHWVGLSSPSIARQFAELLNRCDLSPDQTPVRIATISPVTTAAAMEVGLKVRAEATRYTWDGILDAIVAAERSENPASPV